MIVATGKPKTARRLAGEILARAGELVYLARAIEAELNHPAPRKARSSHKRPSRRGSAR
ncbi:MAG: hypothetical protein K8T25_22995 [Planctomycetia bacterium]|nr:hypothetical protein [Planctomycetia bacterium]